MSLVMCHGRGEPDFVNLIRNGSFVGHADEWVIGFAGSEIDFEPNASRSPGSGSLAVLKTGEQAVARYRPGGAHAVSLNGIGTIDVVGYASTTGDPTNTAAGFFLRFYADALAQTAVGSGVSIPADGDIPLTGAGTWDEVARRAIAVPEGATHFRIEANGSSSDAPVLFDDVYVGAPGEDAPPYTGAQLVPFPANRVLNGEFEGGIDGWLGWWTTETLAHNTATPIAGSGSLSVTTPGGGDEQGAIYPANADLVVVPGEPLRLAVKVKGSGEIKVALYYGGAAPQATVWTGTLSGTPTTVSEDITVPVGAAFVGILVATTTDQAVTFVVDDVSLGTP